MNNYFNSHINRNNVGPVVGKFPVETHPEIDRLTQVTHFPSGLLVARIYLEELVSVNCEKLKFDVNCGQSLILFNFV